MNINKSISHEKSIFLDCLRIIASYTVVFTHSYSAWNKTEYYNEVDWGHTSVIVFFVLSGYMIAYSSIKNNKGLFKYIHARLTRLYSILISALIIAGIIEIIIIHTSPVLAAGYTRGNDFFRYILSGAFLNETWFFSSAPPINRPLWSLSYEFWYYVIFGSFFFLKKTKVNLIVFFLVLLIPGPKILLMMPIWLLGVFAYQLKRSPLPNAVSWLSAFLLLGAGLLLSDFLPSWPTFIGHEPLFYSGQFITDYIVGIVIASCLWIIPDHDNSGKEIFPFLKVIRKLADLTFTVYILHYPFLILFRSIFGTVAYDQGQMWIAIITVLITSNLIGLVLENMRPWWSLRIRNGLLYIQTWYNKIKPENKIAAGNFIEK